MADVKNIDANPDCSAKSSIYNSTFPVLLPYDEALFMAQDEFNDLVKTLCGGQEPSTPSSKSVPEETQCETTSTKAPFIHGLETHAAHFQSEQDLAQRNLALTTNADLTHISTQNALVDLFYDFGEGTTSDDLKMLLENSWREDPLTTLKIIFNIRSIHLGKSNRVLAYNALGWLAETHPFTLLTNLVWLVRPVIDQKAPKSDPKSDAEEMETDNQTQPDPVASDSLMTDATVEDDDFEMVGTGEDMSAEEANPTDDSEANEAFKTHDVLYGLSHGYYKDLLNLVVFAANDELTLDGYFAGLLTQELRKMEDWRQWQEWDAKTAKEKRWLARRRQHVRVVRKLRSDCFYRALHLTVARIFAQQLEEDRKLLDSGKHSDLSKLSLAAKWAPSFGEFHDKHTFILSSISEILCGDTVELSPDDSNREMYLRQVREACRKKYLSPLRKALAVVERDIGAGTFSNINYERVPSLAMSRYQNLFIKKGQNRFSEYLHKVVAGKAKISGATLLPSTLVAKARTVRRDFPCEFSNAAHARAIVKETAIRQIIDGQWKTLLQRVKDSGALDSSIAVCDVSDSMNDPKLGDKTTPMDSAIGLSLLISELTRPPFGGGFITFSARPSYVKVGGPEDTRGFIEKVRYIEQTNWSMNTNFVAVFEDVILPMALSNKLTQEDMVKQVFVFSDMQFDQAEKSQDRWTTSYERIKNKFKDAGYEMPRLVFWNLNSSRKSKPVTVEDHNTALVSGYSQGMLKVFLDGGGFEEETGAVEMKDEEDSVEVVERRKTDQLAFVKKAVSHKAYSMLKVVD